MAIYLLVNGSRLDPETSDRDQVVFRLNLPAHEIRVVSGHARPADLGAGSDWRRLGVALRGLLWRRDGVTIETPIESSAFIDGFHHLEHYNKKEGPFRWTNGDGGLPPDIFPSWHGEALLCLRVYRWHGSTFQPPLKPEAVLLSAFENLGVNCELALAQRHFGVEPPLTLLRWASTSVEKLQEGLENHFAGLGDPGTTKVVWQDFDYRLRTPYLNFHTNANKQLNEAGVREIHATGCATLRLLRRKLLKDIADARRIFVFGSAEPRFDHTGMRRLHDALHAIGPASLLCVTLKTPRSPPDGVESLGSGLYAGYLERFVIPDGPFDEWLALCSRTLALHYGG